MSPDDPRHGTNAGYNAGCHLACCKAAHAAYRKGQRHGHTGSYVDARGTHRRLQALSALGWSLADLSRACDRCDSWAVWVLRCSRVHSGTASLVADLYERLCMTVPTGGYAARERRAAQAKGWAPPLAWDDIDTDEAPTGIDPDDSLDEIDEVAVQRRMSGDTTVALTPAERRAFAERWIAAGHPRRALDIVHGINPARELGRAG